MFSHRFRSSFYSSRGRGTTSDFNASQLCAWRMQALEYGIRFCGRGFKRNTVFDPCQRVPGQLDTVCRAWRGWGLNRQRHPVVDFLIGKLEASRHDADNGVRVTVECQEFVENVRVGTEVTLPCLFTQDRDPIVPGVSSERSKTRPRIGDTPRSSNMSDETADPFRRTGSSGPVSVIALFE